MTATKAKTVHDTIVLERTYKASPARVFAAWADVEARKRWSKPNAATDIVYDRHEFRVGGLDVVRCGEKGDLRWHAEVRYLDIAENARIVCAESISEAGKRAACAMVTVELTATGKDTHQTVTLQIAALDGGGMIAGYREGWDPTLDNLADELAR